MKNSYKLITVGATLLLAAMAGRAESTTEEPVKQEPVKTSGIYVDVDAGAAFQTDVAIKDNTGFIGPGGDVKFDTGFRAGLSVGYNFNKSFSLELEAGIIHNTINQIGIQKLADVGADAELNEIPLMVKGIYAIPLKCHLKPYIGLGVGGMIGLFDSSNVPGAGSLGNPDYSSTDFTFAYQGEAGLKYELGDHVELGVAYKFTGTTDHSWKDNDIKLKTDGTMTHAVEGTLSWRF